MSFSSTSFFLSISYHILVTHVTCPPLYTSPRSLPKLFILFQDDPMYKMKPDDIKLEGSKAYKRKDYPTAVKLYSMVLFTVSQPELNFLFCDIELTVGMVLV